MAAYAAQSLNTLLWPLIVKWLLGMLATLAIACLLAAHFEPKSSKRQAQGPEEE